MKKSPLLFSLIISCVPTDSPIIENSESTVKITENESSESGKIPTTTTVNEIITTTIFNTTSDSSSNLTSDSTSEFFTSSSDSSGIFISSETSETGFDETSSIVECGNSLLEDFEECDDGNIIDDDSCSNECFSPRTVFLTNDYIGLANFGGIEVADEICQFEAELYNVPGIFKAWLSDDDELNDPYYRFGSLNYKGWYKLLPYNNVQARIIKGWNGFLNDLENPINITSAGNKDPSEPPIVKVFNATGPDGKKNITGTTCNNWTTFDVNMSTYVGSPQETASEWYAYGLTSCGSETGGKLYCFQVE